MGVSFSTMITVCINMLLVMLYAWKVSPYQIRPIPKRIKPLLRQHDLWVYFSISLPSVIMLMAEWIGAEILIILSASIGTSALAAMSLSYSFHNFVYQVPFGFQLAVTSVVGNYIGEGSEKLGKLGVFLGVIYLSSITTVCGLLTYHLADEIASVYT